MTLKAQKDSDEYQALMALCAYNVHRAVLEIGSVGELADAIGSSRQAIWLWTKRKNLIGAKAAVKIADITSMEPGDFRPDIFGSTGNIPEELENYSIE